VRDHVLPRGLADRFVEQAEAPRRRARREMTLRIRVALALPDRQEVISLEIEEGASVADALRAARAAQFLADADPAQLRVGIWGKACAMDATLRDGDRVEIYRPLLADPKETRRARAGLKPSTRSRSGP
jgi:putative ubiquitin-RnfH superfamily antitoxin RatB of RatAB toxin-antitoxin module